MVLELLEVFLELLEVVSLKRCRRGSVNPTFLVHIHPNNKTRSGGRRRSYPLQSLIQRPEPQRNPAGGGHPGFDQGPAAWPPGRSGKC